MVVRIFQKKLDIAEKAGDLYKSKTPDTSVGLGSSWKVGNNGIVLLEITDGIDLTLSQSARTIATVCSNRQMRPQLVKTIANSLSCSSTYRARTTRIYGSGIVGECTKTGNPRAALRQSQGWKSVNWDSARSSSSFWRCSTLSCSFAFWAARMRANRKSARRRSISCTFASTFVMSTG